MFVNKFSFSNVILLALRLGRGLRTNLIMIFLPKTAEINAIYGLGRKPLRPLTRSSDDSELHRFLRKKKFKKKGQKLKKLFYER